MALKNNKVFILVSYIGRAFLRGPNSDQKKICFVAKLSPMFGIDVILTKADLVDAKKASELIIITKLVLTNGKAIFRLFV